jgi:hypothetical protein
MPAYVIICIFAYSFALSLVLSLTPHFLYSYICVCYLLKVNSIICDMYVRPKQVQCKSGRGQIWKGYQKHVLNVLNVLLLCIAYIVTFQGRDSENDVLEE